MTEAIGIALTSKEALRKFFIYRLTLTQDALEYKLRF